MMFPMVHGLVGATGSVKGFPQTANPTMTAFGSTTTQHLCNLPPTVDANDLLILFFMANDGLITEPTGWTYKAGVDVEFGNARIYVLKASGSEGGGTIDAVTSLSVTAVSHVYRVTAWSENISTGVDAPRSSSGNSSSPNPRSHTTSWATDSTLWITAAMGLDDDINFSAAPTGYTDLSQIATGAGSNAGCEIGTARKESRVQTEDPSAFTLDSSEAWSCYTIPIRPVA